MLYDGEEVELTPEQEEWATYFAKYLGTEHVKKPQFCANFFKDWLKFLNPPGSKTKHKIQVFEKCDFTPIYNYLKQQQELKKKRTKEEKMAEKAEKQRLKEKYGYAIVDGRKEAVANFTVEPPGLFLGRGNHPKAGKFKLRVMPEQVTLNLDANAPTPEVPIPGHKWGGRVENKEVAWLATWKDNIFGESKYVLFAASSSLRGKTDREKFETARKLKSYIDKIRAQYTAELTAKDDVIRQRATALWVIDHLALRVGNEKNTQDEADTVGCCSLRVEHVKLHPPKTIELDFLGKDSMRYHNTVEVDEQVYKNFERFLKNKSPHEKVFDLLTTQALNKHLSDQMSGLTAKVFRTFNASYTLVQELAKLDPAALAKMTPEEKVVFFNKCNRQVAILCNHQKTVAKNIAEQMQRIDKKIQEIKDKKKELKEHLKALKEGKIEKKKKKSKRKESETSNDNSESEDASKKETKNGETSDDKKKKKRKLPDDPEKIKAQIQKLDARLNALRLKKQDKDENKEVALGTSKINYIDPRIVIAWCTKAGLNINKVFSKTVRERFSWAFEEVEKNPDFQF
jgi:DNA topoisomerase-1